MREPANLIPIDDLLRDCPPSRRYLIGVSGGRDSVALLDQLVRFGFHRLIVCHLNHELRGRSSDADAQFVEKLAKSRRLEFAGGSTDVGARAVQTKSSIETTGRGARYSFFAHTARNKRCRTIFLGHHADDLVETFCLNLFRGAGTSGLASMRQVSQRRVDGVALTIVRPLLSIWRDDIDGYVRKHRLRFREDASNRSLEPLRNRIRHRVIPYLEKTLGKDVRRNIFRTASIVADEEKFLQESVRGVHLGRQLDLQSIRDLPTALQRRTLHQWLRQANVRDVGFDVVERVRRLLDVTAGAKTNLSDNRHVRRRAGKLFME
ncbi:MAG: tRNA lysidine(34) synthetase TilS [Chthoniobacterales bacterium]